MAERLTTALGVLLSGVIAAGTWLYVVGIAPPFPTNAQAFNACFLASLVLALLLGRRR